MNGVTYTKSQLKLLDSYRVPKDKSHSLIRACSESSIVFAKYMLGLELFYWQVDFLHELERIVAGESKYEMGLAITSRQIGKSTCLAVFALWCSIFNKRPDKRYQSTQVSIISRGDEQAKKLLREIRKTYRAGDRYLRNTYLDEEGNSVYGKEFFSTLLSKDDPNNTKSISFVPHGHDGVDHGEYLLKGSNGSSGIKCHPPTAVVLGETFTIGMVDEAAHETITKQFWDEELYPTGDANDALWIFTSTPWKAEGFFYEYCDPESKFSTSHVYKMVAPIQVLNYDKDNPYATKQLDVVLKKIERYKENGELNTARRSYYCEFVQGSKSFFDPLQVREVFTEEIDMVQSYEGECDMGVDFGGKSESRTVITISKYDPDKDRITRLYHKRYELEKDEDLLLDIEELMSRFNIQRIIPDDCPAGWSRIADMQRKGWNITPMTFRTDKMKKYNAFKQLMKKAGEQHIYSYRDNLLRDEMLAMEYSEGAQRSIIVPAKGFSDDLIDAFIMSSYHFLGEGNATRFIEW